MLYAAEDAHKSVLILHSYHETFTWTSNIHRGIKSVLLDGNQDIEVFTEFMDTKRNAPQTMSPLLYNLYRTKYDNKQIDAIIVSDNNALNFLVAYRDSLFTGVPVIFTGINYYTPEMLKGKQHCTGVLETYDLGGTIDMALMLHPHTRRIAVIADNTSTGAEHLEAFRELVHPYLDRYNYSEFVGLPPDSLISAINRLSEPTVVFTCSYYLDNLGNVITETEHQHVADHITCPIYTAWDNVLNYGAVGGMIVSSFAQGEVAARMTLRVLAGTPPEAIPVDSASTIYPMFNYGALERFHIDRKLLPPSAIVLDEPPAPVEKYRQLIRTLLAFTGGLIMLALFLFAIIWLRNRSAKQLRRERERLDLALTGASLGLWDWYLPADRTVYSREWLAMVGYLPGELTSSGETWKEMIHPADRDRVFAVVDAALKGQSDYIDCEHRLRARNGEYVWIHSLGKVVERSKDGSAVRMTGIHQNINARKLAEQQSKRLEEAIEQTSEAIAVTNAKGIVEYVNRAFLEQNRCQTNDIIGKNIARMQYLVDDEVKGNIVTCVSKGNRWSGQLHICRHDDTEYDSETSITPVVGQTGEIVSFLFVNKDVTERLRLERQLQQSQKMEAIGTLAGGIAHDFNNILSVIIGYSELVLQTLSPGTREHRNLMEVLNASDRAKKLVSHILAFSSHKEQEYRPISVKFILKESLELLRSMLPATIEIRREVFADNDVVLADPTQLHQILMNLCANAMQAMEDGGVLTIGLQEVHAGISAVTALPAEDCLVLTVADTGCGIPPDLRERIFDPYFTTKEGRGGTGLGLAIVRGIVRKMGGVISVYSEVGEGTVFEIVLPLVEAEPALEPNLFCHECEGGTEHIMYVDDELHMLGITRQAFEQLGYRVSVFSSSLEALEAFRHAPLDYDIIVTDQTMPRLQGDRLAREALALRADIPVILCTGHSDNLTREKAMDLGVAEFMTKPFLLNDLSSAVRRLLDRSQLRHD